MGLGLAVWGRAHRLDRLAFVALFGSVSSIGAAVMLRSTAYHAVASVAPVIALACFTTLLATMSVCAPRPEELEAAAVRRMAPWRALALVSAALPALLLTAMVAVVLDDGWFAAPIIQSTAVIAAIVVGGSTVTHAGVAGSLGLTYVMVSYYGGSDAWWNLVLSTPKPLTVAGACLAALVSAVVHVLRGPIAVRPADEDW